MCIYPASTSNSAAFFRSSANCYASASLLVPLHRNHVMRQDVSIRMPRGIFHSRQRQLRIPSHLILLEMQNIPAVPVNEVCNRGSSSGYFRRSWNLPRRYRRRHLRPHRH
jgi:hypothetical protein